VAGANGGQVKWRKSLVVVLGGEEQEPGSHCAAEDIATKVDYRKVCQKKREPRASNESVLFFQILAIRLSSLKGFSYRRMKMSSPLNLSPNSSLFHYLTHFSAQQLVLQKTKH
jgi:hypothetical protein